MAESFSIKAILSAADTNFSSTMKACGGYADNLKKTLTSGLGFGAMAAIGSKAVSVVGSGLKTLTVDSVNAGMNFESAMSSVAAISGATGKELKDLTAKAKEMGATTQFSATESANAMEYMAMAGWKTKDMISGIGGIMNLAAASGSDLARTSDIVTDSLTAFGKSAKDSGTFANVMAAASSNANTNVEMMGETFKYVGAAAGAMKYSIQDIALATGLMANSGIKGSEAGTALRSVITRMAKPTKESSAAMKKLGMSMTDSKGNMKSFGAVMKDLRKGMQGMTEDQKASYAAMLGGQEAMSGVLAIANASEKDFNKLSEAINNSAGAAEEMANVKLDNLQGDVTLLKSGMEGLGITIYDQVGGKLRGLVGIATNVVSELNSKLSSGKWIEGTIDKIEKVARKAEPYWNTLKINAIEAGTALGEAFKAVSTDLRELTGEFGSLDSIRSFAGVVGTAKDGIVTFSGFLKEHSATVAKLITLLPKLVVAYKGFKVVKAVAPFVGVFTGAIGGLAKAGLSKIAPGLFKVAGGQEAVGKSSGSSSKKMLASAKSFMMMGVAVLTIAAGFGILAYSAVQLSNSGGVAIACMVGMVAAVAALGAGMTVMINSIKPGPAKLKAISTAMIALGVAVLLVSASFAIMAQTSIALANAGPLAIACMVGMVAAIAGLAVGAAALGPALTAGAVGFIAFGAAIVLVATGALIASAALAVVAGVLPTVAQYGAQGAVAIAQLGAGMLAFGAGAAVAGAGAVVLGAGLTVVAAGLALVGAAVLIAAAGVLVLAAGAAVLGASLVVAGAGLTLMGAAFPLVAAGAMSGAAGLAALLGAGTAASAVFVVLAGSSGAAAVTVGVFAAAMITGAAGTAVMAVAIKAVNSSMKSIAKNAKSAEKSLTSMRSSVNVVNSGLDALGNKAKSAIKALIKQFSQAESKAKTSGRAVGNNFNSGVQSGMSRAVSTANSMTLLAVSAMRSAGSGSYSCGVYIGSGLANGMASQVGRVRSVAAQLAAAAAAAIRAKAQIHSPSKVADKLGGYFGTGWVNGISDKVQDAKRAAMELIQIPKLSTVSDIGRNMQAKVNDLDDSYSYTRNETYTIHVPVEVDGREVAKATATYTKEEIAKQEKRELRKQGRR